MSMSAAANLTKEQLKSELVSMGVNLPPAAAKKEEFQKRYQEHIRQLEKQGQEVEEQESLNDSWRLEIPGDADLEEFIASLPDPELYKALINLGKTIGPVVDSTRALYRKQLFETINERIGPINGVENGSGNGIENGDGSSEVPTEASVKNGTTTKSKPSKEAKSSKAEIVAGKGVEKVIKPKSGASETKKTTTSSSTISSGSPAAKEVKRKLLFEAGGGGVGDEFGLSSQGRKTRRSREIVEASDDSGSFASIHSSTNTASSLRKRKYEQLFAEGFPESDDDGGSIKNGRSDEGKKVGPGLAKKFIYGVGSAALAASAAMAGYVYYMGNQVLSDPETVKAMNDNMMGS